MPSLLLASQSPRRKALLTETGFSFTATASGASEVLKDSVSPSQAVEELAYRKAQAVFDAHPDHVVLGADTVVALQGHILGKPETKEEARRMLRDLSSRSHQVFTGVAILSRARKVVFHEETEVRFQTLDEKLLEAYISSSEPYDKAGGYGIQAKGRLFVQSIHGDYFNVVGLPICRTVRALQSFHIYPSI
ncbi:Maf family protein [Alteribacillus iranensis]|uniref:dTTP/UTP pyrophosphatase n=1 Tax=Alteribacillus iranensis TaxID=930128 RepID=A0A1I2CR74_9BACI|nr:Maf family protein [Alteribacillus iranensis]SFE70672.1 septum formation protein [Alteribacillus iranensis]